MSGKFSRLFDESNQRPNVDCCNFQSNLNELKSRINSMDSLHEMFQQQFYLLKEKQMLTNQDEDFMMKTVDLQKKENELSKRINLDETESKVDYNLDNYENLKGLSNFSVENKKINKLINSIIDNIQSNVDEELSSRNVESIDEKIVSERSRLMMKHNKGKMNLIENRPKKKINPTRSQLNKLEEEVNEKKKTYIEQYSNNNNNNNKSNSISVNKNNCRNEFDGKKLRNVKKSIGRGGGLMKEENVENIDKLNSFPDHLSNVNSGNHLMNLLDKYFEGNHREQLRREPIQYNQSLEHFIEENMRRENDNLQNKLNNVRTTDGGSSSIIERILENYQNNHNLPSTIPNGINKSKMEINERKNEINRKNSEVKLNENLIDEQNEINEVEKDFQKFVMIHNKKQNLNTNNNNNNDIDDDNEKYNDGKLNLNINNNNNNNNNNNDNENDHKYFHLEHDPNDKEFLIEDLYKRSESGKSGIVEHERTAIRLNNNETMRNLMRIDNMFNDQQKEIIDQNIDSHRYKSDLLAQKIIDKYFDNDHQLEQETIMKLLNEKKKIEETLINGQSENNSNNNPTSDFTITTSSSLKSDDGEGKKEISSSSTKSIIPSNTSKITDESQRTNKKSSRHNHHIDDIDDDDVYLELLKQFPKKVKISNEFHLPISTKDKPVTPDRSVELDKKLPISQFQIDDIHLPSVSSTSPKSSLSNDSSLSPSRNVTNKIMREIDDLSPKDVTRSSSDEYPSNKLPLVIPRIENEPIISSQVSPRQMRHVSSNTTPRKMIQSKIQTTQTEMIKEKQIRYCSCGYDVDTSILTTTNSTVSTMENKNYENSSTSKIHSDDDDESGTYFSDGELFVFSKLNRHSSTFIREPIELGEDRTWFKLRKNQEETIKPIRRLVDITQCSSHYQMSEGEVRLSSLNLFEHNLSEGELKREDKSKKFQRRKLKKNRRSRLQVKYCPICHLLIRGGVNDSRIDEEYESTISSNRNNEKEEMMKKISSKSKTCEVDDDTNIYQDEEFDDDDDDDDENHMIKDVLEEEKEEENILPLLGMNNAQELEKKNSLYSPQKKHIMENEFRILGKSNDSNESEVDGKSEEIEKDSFVRLIKEQKSSIPIDNSILGIVNDDDDDDDEKLDDRMATELENIYNGNADDQLKEGSSNDSSSLTFKNVFPQQDEIESSTSGTLSLTSPSNEKKINSSNIHATSQGDNEERDSYNKFFNQLNSNGNQRQQPNNNNNNKNNHHQRRLTRIIATGPDAVKKYQEKFNNSIPVNGNHDRYSEKDSDNLNNTIDSLSYGITFLKEYDSPEINSTQTLTITEMDEVDRCEKLPLLIYSSSLSSSQSSSPERRQDDHRSISVSPVKHRKRKNKKKIELEELDEQRRSEENETKKTIGRHLSIRLEEKLE
ncbi:hypothetical protein SNEBB_007765 [Seison nebaliae]|nr:hypothetical protein SNEBB_007765 [Seison nebaliae]